MINKKREIGNLTGGINAAILSIPKNIAYGIIVFAPLGFDFLPYAILSGFIAFIVINIITTFIYGNPILSNGPASVVALMLSSALVLIVNELQNLGLLTTSNALSFFFLLVIFISLFQIIFAVIKVGELAKYIPYPVVSGITNGGAILIIISQIPSIIGISSIPQFYNIQGYLIYIYNNSNFYLLAMGVGIGLFLILIQRISKKIPASIFAIVFGSLAFYAIKDIYPSIDIGTTIGSVSISLSEITELLRFDSLSNWRFYIDNYSITIKLIIPAFTCSLIITINSLIAQSAADGLLKRRTNSNKEILAQAIGNMITGLLGGFPGNPGLSRTIENYNSGARKSYSKLVSSIFTIAILLLLKETMMYIPLITFTTIIIITAFGRFDIWFFKLFKQLKSKNRREESIINIAVVLFVIIVIIFVGITESVAAGIIISLILYAIRMDRNIIRKEYTRGQFTSNVERAGLELEILNDLGDQIHIIELKGSLFFGNADKLTVKVESLSDMDISFLILDLKKIKSIDLSAIRIVLHLIEYCKRESIQVYFSAVKPSSPLIKEIENRVEIFDILEDAIAEAEKILLLQNLPETELNRELKLDEIAWLYKFSKPELDILSEYLNYVVVSPNSTLFNQGNRGNALYFICSGYADVFQKVNEEDKRLSTICRGAIFGEMSLLDGKDRSATIKSRGEMRCYQMKRDALDMLEVKYPDIALKFISAISSELSKRLRIKNLADIT